MDNQFLVTIMTLLWRIEMLHGKKGNEAYKMLLDILVNPCRGVNETCELRRKIRILASSDEYSWSPIAKIINNEERHKYIELSQQIAYFNNQEKLISLLQDYKFHEADEYYKSNMSVLGEIDYDDIRIKYSKK